MKYELLHRYYLLMEKLRQGSYPSFGELVDHLEQNGLSVSNRTLQRDIQRLREDFAIEVVYDEERRGYYLDEEASVDSDHFIRFLELVGTAQLLSESLEENKKSLRYFDLESSGDLHGTHQLKDMLFAIKHQREVSFQHESFHKGTWKEYRVQPYLLKEYQNRWYLVGLVPSIDSDDPVERSRTFGVDRIHDFKVSDRSYEKDPDYDPHGLFRSTVGLVYSECEPQWVKLWATPLQSKYLNSLPLHDSQECTDQDESGCTFLYWLRPNYEFIQKVMMMGDQVALLEPQWLVNDVRGRLETALGYYR